MAGVLAGHGAELSRARTTYGGDDLDGRRAGVDDDGGAAGRGRDDEIDVVDRKVEDEQRNFSIYIRRDPLVPAGKPNRD